MGRLPHALTFEGVQRMCTPERRITQGPLNDAYSVSLGNHRLFVRHRHLTDDEYGQTFAAERYLPPIPGVRIPECLGVLSDSKGVERFAIFEYIEGGDPDWSRQATLEALVDGLACVHDIGSLGLGNVGGPLLYASVLQHLRDLVTNEVDKLQASERALVGRSVSQRLSDAVGCFEGELPCLCHGDVRSANLRVDLAGDLWLLDWEAARFRVAAADFNQLQYRWMRALRARDLVGAYAALTGRALETLTRQVLFLRFLWHIRTYNFHTLVRRDPPSHHAEHLVVAGDLLRLLGVTRADVANLNE